MSLTGGTKTQRIKSHPKGRPPTYQNKTKFTVCSLPPKNNPLTHSRDDRKAQCQVEEE